MHRVLAAAAFCLLGGQPALAAPLLNAEDLAVDLGYGIYQGSHNFTTQLNVWKGYVKIVTARQDAAQNVHEVLTTPSQHPLCRPTNWRSTFPSSSSSSSRPHWRRECHNVCTTVSSGTTGTRPRCASTIWR
jgi:hypothetical protein